MLSPRHIPNIISIGRIFLVYPVIAAMLYRDFNTALLLFTIAGLSDGVDGFLAKHYGWQSRLGSYLDPAADKLLLVSSYIALARLGLIPLWLTALVVARDIVIFTGAVAYYFLLRPFDGQPSLLSKLNTLCQLVLVFAVLISHGIVAIPAGILTTLIVLVAATTLSSGILYVAAWGASYYRETRASASVTKQD